MPRSFLPQLRLALIYSLITFLPLNIPRLIVKNVLHVHVYENKKLNIHDNRTRIKRPTYITPNIGDVSTSNPPPPFYF